LVFWRWAFYFIGGNGVMIENGIYAGFMTATTGASGMALFVLSNGVLSGADLGGVTFDGDYTVNQNGDAEGSVKVQVPEGITVIQGVTAPPGGLKYEVPILLPAQSKDYPFFLISTPLGKVNVRLQKLRALP
jgi:hypothetical protein